MPREGVTVMSNAIPTLPAELNVDRELLTEINHNSREP